MISGRSARAADSMSQASEISGHSHHGSVADDFVSGLSEPISHLSLREDPILRCREQSQGRLLRSYPSLPRFSVWQVLYLTLVPLSVRFYWLEKHSEHLRVGPLSSTESDANERSQHYHRV